MSDFLAKVAVNKVAAWYRRLGEAYVQRAPELERALAGGVLGDATRHVTVCNGSLMCE